MTSTRPVPRFGWNGQEPEKTEMPENYYMDFSYTQSASEKGWIWVANITVGGRGTRSKDENELVWKLQREHGCYNVTSGNANPLSPDQIGVYVGPYEGKHRDGKHAYMCKCFG